MPVIDTATTSPEGGGTLPSSLATTTTRDARQTLGAGDDFRSPAQAFPTVPPQYLRAVKLQQLAVTTDDGAVSSATVVDRLLIDLADADPALMDAAAIVRDCEHVRDLVLRNPDAPRRIVAAFQADAPSTDLLAAASLAAAIGLTEEAAIEAKGGLVFLLFLLAGAVGAAAGAVALNTANGIKYNHAVGRATSKDPNAGIIKNQ